MTTFTFQDHRDFAAERHAKAGRQCPAAVAAISEIQNLFPARGEKLMRELGSFEGERRARSRGYTQAASPARDWSSGLSVLFAIAMMYLIIGVGLHEVVL